MLINAFFISGPWTNVLLTMLVKENDSQISCRCFWRCEGCLPRLLFDQIQGYYELRMAATKMLCVGLTPLTLLVSWRKLKCYIVPEWPLLTPVYSPVSRAPYSCRIWPSWLPLTWVEVFIEATSYAKSLFLRMGHRSEYLLLTLTPPLTVSLIPLLSMTTKFNCKAISFFRS